MHNLKYVLVAMGLMVFAACSGQDGNQSSGMEVSSETIMEADSISADLSAAEDSVENKMNELQSSLDNLNN